MRPHRYPCDDPDCGHCESRAEDRATDVGDGAEWQGGQDAFERQLDRMGGSL